VNHRNGDVQYLYNGGDGNDVVCLQPAPTLRYVDAPSRQARHVGQPTPIRWPPASAAVIGVNAFATSAGVNAVGRRRIRQINRTARRGLHRRWGGGGGGGGEGGGLAGTSVSPRSLTSTQRRHRETAPPGS